MIIWGSRARQKQIGTGTFYCPKCRRDSTYSHLRVSRYFTLYFIPLFPTQTLGEAVACQTCAGQFNPTILSLTAEQIESALQPWVCGSCGNRNSRSEPRCLSCGSAPGALPASQPPPLPGPAANPPQLDRHDHKAGHCDTTARLGGSNADRSADHSQFDY